MQSKYFILFYFYCCMFVVYLSVVDCVLISLKINYLLLNKYVCMYVGQNIDKEYKTINKNNFCIRNVK